MNCLHPSVQLKIEQLSQAAAGDVLLKNVFWKNFTNFTGKHFCWSLFLIKLQSNKKSSYTVVEFVKFCENFAKSEVFWNLRKF